MPKFDDYTQKTTPEDTDIALILDKTANVNKKTPFSGIWNWIVKKLAEDVISQLQTSNKTVIGAINELNSKRTIGEAKIVGFVDKKYILIRNIASMYGTIILATNTGVFDYFNISKGNANTLHLGSNSNANLTTTEDTVTIETSNMYNHGVVIVGGALANFTINTYKNLPE